MRVKTVMGKCERTTAILKKILPTILMPISVIFGIGFLISQSYTNFHYEKLPIDIQIFVIIGAIPWFIILPFCSGVFLFVAAEQNILKKDQPTTYIHLLDIDRSNEFSRSTISRQTTIDCHDAETWETFEMSVNRRNEKKLLGTRRWGFYVTMVVISISLIINSMGDFYTAYNEFSNKTRMAIPWHRSRSICRVGAYLLNPILLIPVIVCLLALYHNIAVKCDKLKEFFLQDNPNIEHGINQIAQWSEKSFFSHKNSTENILLRKSNIFASFFLLCCLTWSLGTVYYLFKTKSTITVETGLYIKCLTQLVFYATFVFFMWWTNRIVDNAKDTITQVLGLKSLKKQDSTIDMTSFQIILKNCDSYVKLFERKPSVPGIAFTIISAGAPLLVRFIQKEMF